MKKTKDYLRQAIASRPNRDLSALSHDYACVALILHETKSADLEIAVIRRAEVETDPWAGHLAFPGGRREPSDPDDIFSAARETREEIGIALDMDAAIGRIDDVQARRGGNLLNFFLRPVVFMVEAKGDAVLDPLEVAHLYWMPLSQFLDPSNHLMFRWDRDGGKMDLPGIRFPDGKIFWGLSYMLLTDFVRRLADARLHAQLSALGQLSNLAHWR